MEELFPVGGIPMQQGGCMNDYIWLKSKGRGLLYALLAELLEEEPELDHLEELRNPAGARRLCAELEMLPYPEAAVISSSLNMMMAESRELDVTAGGVSQGKGSPRSPISRELSSAFGIMAGLALLAAEATEDDFLDLLLLQHKFMAEHLGRWDFLQEGTVELGGRSSPYFPHLLLELAVSLIRLDKRVLKVRDGSGTYH